MKLPPWDGQVEMVECSHCKEVLDGPVDLIEQVVDDHHVTVHGCPSLASDELNPPTMADELLEAMNPELDCGHTPLEHALRQADIVTGGPFGPTRNYHDRSRRVH